MHEPLETVDLRQETDSRLALAALAAVRELRPGRALRLLTREDPALLLRSLNLQLRDALAWGSDLARRRLGGDGPARARHAGAGRARCADARPPPARRASRAGAAAPERRRRGGREADAGVIRCGAEAPRRGGKPDRGAASSGPSPRSSRSRSCCTSTTQLLQQLDEVEKCFAEAPAGGVPEAWEVEPFVAILSGTLAKHEHREEGNLFPLWAARLALRPAAEREALQQRVRAALAG